MNCKPGDMAVVVGSRSWLVHRDWLLGHIVTVVRVIPQTKYPTRTLWELKEPIDIPCTNYFFNGLWDDILQPIRGAQPGTDATRTTDRTLEHA